MKRCCLFLAVGFLTGGCTVHFPLVGSFTQSNEVFDGEITHNPFTPHSDMRVQSHVSGVTGRGYAQVTHVPYNTLTGGGEIKGQRGIFEVNCDDGRLVKGTWVAETLTSGYGWGEDQYGNPVRFTFGMKREEVPTMVAAELAKAAKRPPLPPPGAPTTQPVLVREVQK
jgi:hypothetical protein